MDVRKVLEALASLLPQKEEPYELYLCGSAVIDLRYGREQKTNDCDAIGEIDPAIFEAAWKVAHSEIGIANVLAENWLNDNVRRFNLHLCLPPDWEKRAEEANPIFSSSSGNLRVYGLARMDVIRSKLFAMYDPELREVQIDIIDFKNMGVTPDEIRDCSNWLGETLEYCLGRRLRKEEIDGRIDAIISETRP